MRRDGSRKGALRACACMATRRSHAQSSSACTSSMDQLSCEPCCMHACTFRWSCSGRFHPLTRWMPRCQHSRRAGARLPPWLSACCTRSTRHARQTATMQSTAVHHMSAAWAPGTWQDALPASLHSPPHRVCFLPLPKPSLPKTQRSLSNP